LATSNKKIDNIILSIEQLPQARIVSLWRGNRRILGWCPPEQATRGTGKSHLQNIKDVLCSEYQQRGTYQIRYKTAQTEKDYDFVEYQKVIGTVNGELVVADQQPSVVANEYADKNASDVLLEIQVLKIRAEYAAKELAALEAKLEHTQTLLEQANATIEELEDQIDALQTPEKKGMLADMMENPEKLTPLLNTVGPLLEAGINWLGNALRGEQQPSQPAIQQQQPAPQSAQTNPQYYQPYYQPSQNGNSIPENQN
jgi:hypothetical protein